MYDVILVGTDGSPGANRAVTHGLELADQYQADLHVIGVVNTRRYGEPALSSTELVVNEIEERVRTDLAEIADRAAGKGVQVETKCCHGDPHEEILGYADDVDADVVILGYQGRTHSPNHIGSVATKVTSAIDRPLLLV